MNKQKNIRSSKDPEFAVDSRYDSKNDKKNDGALLMDARLKRMNDLSKDDLIKARLLQLKFRMEDFLKQAVNLESNFFTEFLTNYIDVIYDRRNKFAEDIDITPVNLSQVLNNHREPSEEFMLRLMLHSELAFNKFCTFNKKTWFQVYYHEKICDTMSSQDEWRPQVKKHVKFQNSYIA